MIGKTVGKYRFVEELSRDGTSVLYKAVDETLEREVAIKVLNPQLTDSEVMKHFQAEATTLARLHHPDIAGIHEIYRSEKDLLLVMELVRGETLDQLATRCGPLPPERAAYLVAQVLGALQYAHGAGVVHRDLKPTNVAVTEQGGVKVMDFGIARVAGDDQLTADGFALSSPAYMAPERLSGKEIDGRADVYSAGVIFYRLLTGHVPFEAPTPLEMVQKQLASNPTPAVAHRADLPGWCQAILDRALARSPADRFSTAEAFRATLLAAISEATETTGAYVVPVAGAAPAAFVDDGATRAVSRPPPAPPVPSADPLTVAAFKAPLSNTGATAAATAPVAATGKGSPATAGTTLVLKKNQFAIVGGLLVVLVIGVILLAVAALRRPTQVVVAPADQAIVASTPAAAPTETPVQTPGATAPPLEIVAPPLVLPPPAAAPKPAQRTPAADPVLAATPTPSVAVPMNPAPPAAHTLNTTPFTFDAKAVVADGDKRRERDAVVLLADGAVTVKDKNDKVKPLYVLPIDTVVALTYSKSNQPLWNSPSGPAEAMRVEGGAFGFLKGGSRNWFGLRTKEFLLVLRVDDDAVANVTAGLEQRTGLSLERLVEPKEP